MSDVPVNPKTGYTTCSRDFAIMFFFYSYPIGHFAVLLSLSVGANAQTKNKYGVYILIVYDAKFRVEIPATLAFPPLLASV